MKTKTRNKLFILSYFLCLLLPAVLLNITAVIYSAYGNHSGYIFNIIASQIIFGNVLLLAIVYLLYLNNNGGKKWKHKMY